jgi:hypothetical protein
LDAPNVRASSSFRYSTVVIRHSVCCLVLLCVAGCGDRSSARFVPSEQTAHQALDAVLSAWQAGEPPATIRNSTGIIEVSDSHRKTGQTLEAYEIFGPVPGDSPRCFAVKLKLENPAEELRVRYVVFGPNPYWVMRHEDLEMVAHWDHNMEPENKKDGEKIPRK